jgi:alcohol dehydrogenase
MWKYSLPVEINFGCGSAAGITETVKQFGTKCIVVTDDTIVKLPSVQKIICMLYAEVFTEVRPNPTVENVDNLAAVLRQREIDVAVAIGGGSVIDCAKAACFTVANGGNSIRNYHTGGDKIAGESLPLIAMPTTAGTGSEVTPFAVLDDPENNFKGPIAGAALYPRIALVDPELTLSVPAKVTADTALDALSHAIEGYWSKNHLPLCDALAVKAAGTIFANLEKVLDEPHDLAGREALSYAALLAGMAFQIPKNAIMHACSFPLSQRFHMAHGAACAFTMEGAIELNAPCMDGRMEEFAAGCGFGSIPEMTKRITELKRRGGLPLTLAEANIPLEEVDALIEASFHPLMNNNPKTITVEDLKNLYTKLEG